MQSDMIPGLKFYGVRNERESKYKVTGAPEVPRQGNALYGTGK